MKAALPLFSALLLAALAAPAGAQPTPSPQAPQTAAVGAPAADAAQPAVAKKEDGIPEDCTKLVAAIVACRKAGGWKQAICEKGAQMQYGKCPIPVDKLPL